MCYLWSWWWNAQRQCKASRFRTALTHQKCTGILTWQHFQWYFAWNARLVPCGSFQFDLFTVTQTIESLLLRGCKYFRTGIGCNKRIQFIVPSRLFRIAFAYLHQTIFCFFFIFLALHLLYCSLSLEYVRICSTGSAATRTIRIYISAQITNLISWPSRIPPFTLLHSLHCNGGKWRKRDCLWKFNLICMHMESRWTTKSQPKYYIYITFYLKAFGRGWSHL